MIIRKVVRLGVASLLAMTAVTRHVAAQADAAYPNRPVHIVVGFSPGGGNDILARLVGQKLSESLGQPVIIDNKPGAGAIIGADFVAKSKPDGYTWLIGAAGVVTNSMIRSDMPYADSDLVPVGMIAVAPSVIVVNPSVPVSTLKELVAWSKTQPGGLNWATAGGGSTPHFVAEMLREAGVAVNIVPYKSGAESVTAVIANNVSATSEASIVVLPQVKGGKLKAIATTYTKRITAYDALPTAREQGFAGVEIGHWAGLFAPKGTPPAIVERMSKELEAAVKSADFRDKMLPSGIEPEPGTTANFVTFIGKERDRLGKLAKNANMKADQ